MTTPTPSRLAISTLAQPIAATHHPSARLSTVTPLKPGRLLILSTNLGLGGGAEEQVLQLSTELKDRGWLVGIVSMLPVHSMPEGFEASGIPVMSLNMKPGVADPRVIARFADIVRRFQPDILHSHMTHANLLARTTRLFAKVPALVCTLHGSKMHSVKGGSTRLREIGHRLTDRLADMTTAISQAAVDSYIQDGAVPCSKIITLPNGVDTTRFRPRPEIREGVRASLGLGREFVWLAVGRFELPKNYALMMRAFSFAMQTCSRTSSKAGMRLLVCGTGSMKAETEALARELGIEQRVTFLGLRRDVPEIMNAADAYLLSSDTEGLPMVLLQASASGLPIVSTAVGGNAEVVQHNSTGYLTGRGDAKALADSMVRMMQLDPYDRTRMGEAGRAYTHANFGIDHVVDTWEALYHRLLDPKSASQGKGK